MQQLYIYWKGTLELKELIAALEERGYRNVQHLDAGYCFPIIVADLNEKIFFGTNTTCMAALASGHILQTHTLTTALPLLKN